MRNSPCTNWGFREAHPADDAPTPEELDTEGYRFCQDGHRFEIRNLAGRKMCFQLVDEPPQEESQWPSQFQTQVRQRCLSADAVFDVKRVAKGLPVYKKWLDTLQPTLREEEADRDEMDAQRAQDSKPGKRQRRVVVTDTLTRAHAVL